MLRIAIPSVLQQSTVSIGMMIVQAVVNPFGTQALAGYAATMRVENVFSLMFVSIGNAVSPYVSQNLGANKTSRIKKGYRAALLLDACFAALAFIVIENTAYSDFIIIPGQRRNSTGISGVWKLYEMAWLFLYLYGYQDGNRWGASWPWNYASIPYCEHGKSCDSFIGRTDFCTAFWYCICLACCTCRMACKLFDFLCSP